MYEVTGYHLKDLQIVDGKYVTEDGRDLLEVYKEALRARSFVETYGGRSGRPLRTGAHEACENGL